MCCINIESAIFINMIEVIIISCLIMIPINFMLFFGLVKRQKLNCGDNCKCMEENGKI